MTRLDRAGIAGINKDLLTLMAGKVTAAIQEIPVTILAIIRAVHELLLAPTISKAIVNILKITLTCAVGLYFVITVCLFV